MTQYITRAYNTFSFNYQNSSLKKHSKEDRLAQETEYYKSVPQSLSVYFPRLLSSGFDEQTKEYFLELELYPYQNLGQFLISGQLEPAAWSEIAEHLKSVLGEFGRVVSPTSFSKDLENMYIHKTESEYHKLKTGFPRFTRLCQSQEIILNGKTYKNFEIVWPLVKEKYRELLLHPRHEGAVIHGDFCFSNILAGFLVNGKSILRFVDPRGKFGDTKVYGDVYYDLAKLMHSTDVGYEYFIYDQFRIAETQSGIFELSFANDHKQAVHKIFLEKLYSQYDLARIILIQATIFVGMCARHYDSEDRQLAMYLSGVRLLNELMERA